MLEKFEVVIIFQAYINTGSIVFFYLAPDSTRFGAPSMTNAKFVVR